jgi:hypothetical protein
MLKKKTKTASKTVYNRVRELKRTVLKVEEVICPVLKIREEKRTFVKIKEEKVDFFLNFSIPIQRPIL